MRYFAKPTIDVLLTTEGTYPTTRGGVSTWCEMLVRGVQGVRYHIYTILGHPYLPDRYRVPAGVRVQRVPMWGTEDASEHLDIRFSAVFERKQRTTAAVVRREFLPLLDELLTGVLGPEKDGRRFGLLLYHLYQFFQMYDYLEAFKSEPVWQFYLDGLRRRRWTGHPAPITLLEALQTMGWLYRFLVVLNIPVPRTDVSHASAAAFCGLPAVLAKLEHNTPYLLTEHGVYLREQYLHIGRSPLPPFGKHFLMNLVQAVVLTNYAYADLVAPVCAFNARWERRLGVPAGRIRVIYNGVDPKTFIPRPRPAGAPPTVVSVARIDPAKDILTLLRAAARVREQMPEVRFVVYGGVSVPGYYQRCLELRKELGLTDAFIFAGHVDNVPAAYASGDVVVLSSITEGFPYAVVEALMCARPVVATDVGGTREACGGVGLLVPPGDPEAMSRAILRLLRDPVLRAEMAEEGRQRALAYFTVERNLNLYRSAYLELYERRQTRTAAADPAAAAVEKRRRLAVERGEALAAAGHLEAAIRELRLAVDLAPAHPATPALLLRLAALYVALGQHGQALRELERAEAAAALVRARAAA